MLKGKWMYLSLVCFAVFIVSCATVMSGKSQTVTFTSEPEGATVIVAGRTLGKTPLTIPLEKKSEPTAVFEKEGYESVTMALSTTMEGWFWGNIVIGGLLGSTTDGLTGAVHRYSPSSYHITLKPKKSAFFTPRGEIKVFVLSNYYNIAKEANTSPKIYLPALFSLLKVPKSEQGVETENIKKLIKNSEHSLAFAENIIDNYLKIKN